MQKKITKTATIVESVGEGQSDFEYIVENGASATILLSALNVKNADANVSVRLAHKDTSATIIGIVVGNNSSTVKLHTMQIHEAPQTSSNLLVKTVLTDHARCLYDGGIRVEKNAQRTDAYQRNENLLLSDTAHSESKPSLEILANDVRCTHGATVGPIDEDQLWYLASRGISIKPARKLIIEGFIKSALDLVGQKQMADTLLQETIAAI